MTDNNPADELRAAANLIRERAQELMVAPAVGLLVSLSAVEPAAVDEGARHVD